MRLFDTHTHIYLSEKKTENEVIQNIVGDSDIKYITSIGIDIPTSLHNIELANTHNWIIPSIGIHPCHVEEYKDSIPEILSQLEEMLIQSSGKIRAIGECGLDYYRLPPKLTQTNLDAGNLQELQKGFFRSQIRLAKKHSLPIIIHNREAKDDVFKILEEEDCKNFVFHCYSEDLNFAKKILSFAPDSYISFSGIVTFHSAKALQEVAVNIPLKNILIETDCPYLAPTPERGTENYPNKVKFVLKKIQSLRIESPEQVQETIFENSCDFFGIKS